MELPLVDEAVSDNGTWLFVVVLAVLTLVVGLLRLLVVEGLLVVDKNGDVELLLDDDVAEEVEVVVEVKLVVELLQ